MGIVNKEDMIKSGKSLRQLLKIFESECSVFSNLYVTEKKSAPKIKVVNNKIGSKCINIKILKFIFCLCKKIKEIKIMKKFWNLTKKLRFKIINIKKR